MYLQSVSGDAYTSDDSAVSDNVTVIFLMQVLIFVLHLTVICSVLFLITKCKKRIKIVSFICYSELSRVQHFQIGYSNRLG